MKVITTIPPYAPFIGEVFEHPLIQGTRLNTVMPIKEPLEEMLARIKKLAGKKDFWIDLKYRQIRTAGSSKFFKEPGQPRVYKIGEMTYVLDPISPRAYGSLRTPPWADIPISHKIKLDLSKGPIKCIMNDGYDSAMIVEVIDGNRLIMLEGPQKIVGEGESINILDPSFEVEGTFTDLDLQYIEAAKKTGIHTYMLSYVEQDSDVENLFTLDAEAVIVAKIESKRGLEWLKTGYPKYKDRVRLMAARGDLYIEVGRPDKILRALRLIIRADPEAIVASRILTSLMKNPTPICSDVTDVACLIQMGYKSFMVGDDICFNRDMLFLALDILGAIGDEYAMFARP